MHAKKILLVEDDADSASILEAYLRRDGFDVAVAEDGQKAVALHAQWKPDLVLLDIMLPILGGTEVLSTIRRSSDTPVIMVTAMGDEPEKLGALRYGADDYVVKPYSPKEKSWQGSTPCCVARDRHEAKKKSCCATTGSASIRLRCGPRCAMVRAANRRWN